MTGTDGCRGLSKKSRWMIAFFIFHADDVMLEVAPALGTLGQAPLHVEPTASLNDYGGGNK